MAEPYLEIKNLVHEYNNKRVVAIERLTIKKGEVFVLIGPNGAGKSTLLRLINLLERPTSGEILIKGSSVQSEIERLNLRREMALVFQEPVFLKTSVFENVAYGLKVRRHPKREIEEKVTKILDNLGILHLAHKPATSLSDGEAQRVSLARALILEPELLLLDEPLNKLDTPTKEELGADLFHLLKENGFTAIYVTHNPAEARVYADRIGVMIGGEIVQISTLSEILDSPVSLKAARLIGLKTALTTPSSPFTIK